MLFSDIVALAKAGYKPADVKELMALSTDKPVEQTVTGSADQKDELDMIQPAPAAEEAQSAGDRADESAEKIKSLEDEIKRLQAQNAAKDRPEPEKRKSDSEILEGLARKFM